MLSKTKKIIKDIIKAFDQFVGLCLRLKYTFSARIPLSAGYEEYKYYFINNILSNGGLLCFENRQLPPNYGFRLDERVVEYPWFFSSLRDEARVILDAGSVLNSRQILSTEKLRNRKLYLTTLSYEGRVETVPSPSYIYEDLRNMCYKDDFFDAICSLSTIEHIGLDNTKFYTHDPAKKENDINAYLIAIKEFKRVLKAGGMLYLTVPFGKYNNHGWFQTFNAEMINNLIETFAPASFSKTYFRYEKDQWNFSTEELSQDGDYFDIHNSSQFTQDYLVAARCVACIALTK